MVSGKFSVASRLENESLKTENFSENPPSHKPAPTNPLPEN
jgi:hypothetical protein